MSHRKTAAMLLRNYFVEQFHSAVRRVWVYVFAQRGIQRDSSSSNMGTKSMAVGDGCSDDGKNNSEDFGGFAMAAGWILDDKDDGVGGVGSKHKPCVSWKMRKSFQKQVRQSFNCFVGCCQRKHERATQIR